MRVSRPILSYGLLTYTGRVPRIHRVSHVFPYGPPGVYERHVYRMSMDNILQMARVYPGAKCLKPGYMRNWPAAVFLSTVYEP
ncbi:hypothetical protein XENOCAPTIV_005338, partial [Xenoophorus captivus]